MSYDHFVLKAWKTHQDFYDYSKVIYAGCTQKVEIVCREHGSFWQTPNDHYRGRGCPECKKTKLSASRKMSWEVFVEKAAAKHSGRYEYISEDEDSAVISCSLHGRFTQRKAKHLFGQGCPKCKSAGRIKIPFREFVARVGNRDLKFVESSYQGTSKKVTAVCSVHGEFTKKAGNFLHREEGCPKCAKSRAALEIMEASREGLQEKVDHLYGRGVYEVDHKSYEGSKKPMRFVCHNHGEFWIRPNDILSGHACQTCGGSVSAAEVELRNFLGSLGVEYQQNVRGLLETGEELDLFLPEFKMGIEYCGLYWHREELRGRKYHWKKMKEAAKVGIRLVTIFEDEWREKRSIVQSRLRSLVGKPAVKRFARKLTVVRIDWRQVADFYERTHTQGAGSPGSCHYALICDDGKVRACMSFGKLRYETQQDDCWELLRFSSDGQVVGGFGRLLAHFIRTFAPKQIISYADQRWSQGDVYQKCGFTFVKETAPNYFWCRPNKRWNRQKFMKYKLKRLLPKFDKTLTEVENCEENGLFRIFDCGNSKWVWKAL